jgi:hypothetical protein
MNMKPTKLTEPQTDFLRKLCRPNPFTPTADESKMIREFAAKKIVKGHNDGSIEVTNFGADCFALTLE